MIGRHSRRRTFGQFRQIGLHEVELGVGRAGDGVPGQGIVQGGFAFDVGAVIQRVGENDVRAHAFELGRGAVHTVKFADGDFHLAGIIGGGGNGGPHELLQLVDALHGAFAKT